MIAGTRAIEIECAVCKAQAGAACDLEAGTGWEETQGSYHKVRVVEAAKITRRANRAARERGKPDTPGA